MDSREFPMSPGTMGSFLGARFRVVRNDFFGPGGPAPEQLEDAYQALIQLENDLIFHSNRVIFPGPLAPSRMYAFFGHDKRDFVVARLRARVIAFLQEIDELEKDWSRNSQALKQFGIDAAADMEVERIRSAWPESRNLSRLPVFFEQLVAFYRLIAIDRFASAVQPLKLKQEYESLCATAELRRRLGARLEGFDKLEAL